MKIFLNRSMYDHRGDAIKKPKKAENEEDEVDELGAYMIEGLLRDLDQDKSQQANLKVKRWELARKIQKKMDADKSQECCMDIPSDDVAMIKQRLGVFMPTVLLGPIYEAIEPTIEEAKATS